MDNPKIILKKSAHGKGVFAKECIKKGEVLASFDGTIYHSSFRGWDNAHLRNHVVQFDRHYWRDAKGIARYFNHSCEPNCGIKNLFDVVAMRDISAGEECTWDYDMTEDALDGHWSMHCKCGTKSCRKKIGAYRNMPLAIRKKYKGYISAWLLNEKK